MALVPVPMGKEQLYKYMKEYGYRFKNYYLNGSTVIRIQPSDNEFAVIMDNREKTIMVSVVFLRTIKEFLEKERNK